MGLFNIFKKKSNQGKEKHSEWQEIYERNKEKFRCRIDLDKYFSEKKIGEIEVDILDIGEVNLPTGEIRICGGKIMKKYISIALVLIFVLAFTACGSDKKISLPEPDDITEIEIMKSTSSSGVKITEQDDISIIISDIKENTKNTGKESVNDQPTNIGDYFIVKIYHENVKDSPSIAYLYEDKDKVYVEQPYSGIWKLKNDCYDNIISFILSETDDSYKPLIKLNDKIFGWVRDLGEVKLGDMEFLGEIKSSKESLSKGLNRGDENFSSNIYPTGTKIYKWDEKSILVESNNTFSICEVVE